MRVDGLEEAERDPCVDDDDVQAVRRRGVDERARDGAGGQDEHFERVRVFGGEPEGRGVFVVDLVDVLVQEGRVQELVVCDA